MLVMFNYAWGLLTSFINCIYWIIACGATFSQHTWAVPGTCCLRFCFQLQGFDVHLTLLWGPGHYWTTLTAWRILDDALRFLLNHSLPTRQLRDFRFKCFEFIMFGFTTEIPNTILYTDGILRPQKCKEELVVPGNAVISLHLTPHYSLFTSDLIPYSKSSTETVLLFENNTVIDNDTNNKNEQK